MDSLKNGHLVLLYKQCTTEFLFPQLTDEALQQLYTESYYAAWGLIGDTDNAATRQMKLITFELYLKLLKRQGQQGRLLDVGFGVPGNGADTEKEGTQIEGRRETEDVFKSLPFAFITANPRHCLR